MPSYTYEGLIDYVRGFAAEILGGVPSDLEITLIGQQKPFHAPVPASSSRTTAPPSPVPPPRSFEEPKPEDTPPPRFYKLMGDILEVIDQSKQMLTGMGVKAALSLAEKEWSDRWVDEMLARLVDDGTLENIAKVKGKPHGYRRPRNDA